MTTSIYSNHGKDMTLKEVLMSLPKIDKYKVSRKARAEGGFLNKFIEVDGDLLKLSDEMLVKRHSFLQRTVSAYIKNPTYRRLLSLYAWAYEPDKKVEEPVKKKTGPKRLTIAV